MSPQLVFDIAMRAGGRGCTNTDSIFYKRIEVANITGIEPMKRIGERKIDCIALVNQLNEGEFGIDIPIGNIRSTYNGVLGSVTYELSMTIMTTFGSPDSTIRVPIIMHRRRANSAAGPFPDVAEPFRIRFKRWRKPYVEGIIFLFLVCFST
jgi:hypothetical protein